MTLIVGFFFHLLCLDLGATTFTTRPMPEVIHDAPIIVRGRAGSSHAEWSKSTNSDDKNRKIYTYTNLNVYEVLKGPRSLSNLTLRQLGGEKDGIGMNVSGAAAFEKGEEVVVFLSERNSDDTYDVMNFMMGKFNLEKDFNGHEVLIGPAIPVENSESSVSKWTIDRLKHYVQLDQENSNHSQPTSVPKEALTNDSDMSQTIDKSAASSLQTNELDSRRHQRLSWILFGSGILITMIGILFWIFLKSRQRR